VVTTYVRCWCLPSGLSFCPCSALMCCPSSFISAAVWRPSAVGSLLGDKQNKAASPERYDTAADLAKYPEVPAIVEELTKLGVCSFSQPTRHRCTEPNPTWDHGHLVVAVLSQFRATRYSQAEVPSSHIYWCLRADCANTNAAL
jgi:hypothetical protein